MPQVWFRQREAFPGRRLWFGAQLSRTSSALCTALYLGRVPEVSWHIGRVMPSPDPTGCTRHHRASHPQTRGAHGASSLAACPGRSPVTTPSRGRRTDPTSHPLPSGGPHTTRSTSRRRFPALCENVPFVAPSLTLKNVPLFTMLFPLITVGLQEIFLENYFRLAGIAVWSQGWKTHLNLFSFYLKKSLSPEVSDEFG